METSEFLKTAGEKFVDSETRRFKILGPISDAPIVKNDQLVRRHGKDGYSFRLATNCIIPGLKGPRTLLVRTNEIKDEYNIVGVKHLENCVNPNTNEISIHKGSYTFAVI